MLSIICSILLDYLACGNPQIHTDFLLELAEIGGRGISDGHFTPVGQLSERYWMTLLAVRSVQLLPLSNREKNLPSFAAR